MIEFKNALTGTIMLVAESRKDEYIAAGHFPVANTSVKLAKIEEVEETIEEPEEDEILKEDPEDIEEKPIEEKKPSKKTSRGRPKKK